ncbi:antitoxin [Sulfurimonas sp.]|uniref:antitoxin n=1 Tax=Sulfurimonas sp. TaxID=2022749 RepID=UPI003D10B7C7
MSAVAKLFKNGQSQAVRLPKEFRFENQEELFIKRVEDGVILMPKNDKSVWEHMLERLDEFSDDFMQTRVQPTQTREGLF